MNQIKEIRKQIRTVVKDLLPEVLGSELQQSNAKALQESMHVRMTEITKNINDYLKSIEDRQKDFHSYVLRQLTPPTTATPENKEPSTITQEQKE